MEKKLSKEETKNSVLLMYVVLGAIVFILGIIIVLNFLV